MIVGLLKWWRISTWTKISSTTLDTVQVSTLIIHSTVVLKFPNQLFYHFNFQPTGRFSILFHSSFNILVIYGIEEVSNHLVLVSTRFYLVCLLLFFFFILLFFLNHDENWSLFATFKANVLQSVFFLSSRLSSPKAAIELL